MTNKQKKEEEQKKNTNYDLISKDIIRNFPEELISLFFKDELGKFDFSKSEVLSDNVNSITKRGNEVRYTDVIMTANIVSPGTLIKIIGEVLFLFEPHSYKWYEKKQGRTFAQRMYDYMLDATYHHGKNPHTNTRRVVIPIALFYKEAQDDIPTNYKEEGLIDFNFFKVNIHRLSWKDYVGVSNPVAAAFMGLMECEKNDKVEMKLEAYQILSRCDEVIADREKRYMIINVIEELTVLKGKQRIKFIEEFKKLQTEDKNMELLASPIESETIKDLLFTNLYELGGIQLDNEYKNIIKNEYDSALLKKLSTKLLKEVLKEKEKNSLKDSLQKIILSELKY